MAEEEEELANNSGIGDTTETGYDLVPDESCAVSRRNPSEYDRPIGLEEQKRREHRELLLKLREDDVEAAYTRAPRGQNGHGPLPLASHDIGVGPFIVCCTRLRR